MKHKIPYRVFGDKGPRFLLLHGYGGSPRHWSGLADQLAQQHQVIVPHLSSIYISSDPLFFTVQVGLVLKFIETHFPGQSLHLAGLSYGGLLAWAMSLQRPDLFEKVHLINPVLPPTMAQVKIPELRYALRVPFHFQTLAFLFSTPIGKRFLKKTSTIFSDDPDGANFKRLGNLQGRKLLFVTQMLHHFSWVLRTEDWSWWLNKSMHSPRQQASTDLIVTANDPLFSLDNYKLFHQTQKLNHLHVLEKGGHLVSLTEPQEILQKILDKSIDRNLCENLQPTGSE